MNPAPVSRIALVSDVHVRPYRTDGLAGSDEYAWIDALTEHVLVALPDAILIAGDLFDRSHDTAHAADAAQRMLDRWSEGGRPVAIIGGNHDAEVSLPRKLVLAPSVQWFPADQAETLVLHELGIAIHGQSVAVANDHRNVHPGFPAPIAGLTNIALLHTSLGGKRSKRICLPVELDALKRDHRYDVWVLGHVHERHVLNDSPLIVFPGNVDPTTFDILLLELSYPAPGVFSSKLVPLTPMTVSPALAVSATELSPNSPMR